MEKLTLWCVVDGEFNLFKVKISSNEDIADLKKLIWEERKERLFKGVDAADLMLYKPKIPISTTSKDKLNARIAGCDLDTPEGQAQVEELDPTSTVEECGLSQPANKQLHILVRVQKPNQIGECQRRGCSYVFMLRGSLSRQL